MRAVAKRNQVTKKNHPQLVLLRLTKVCADIPSKIVVKFDNNVNIWILFSPTADPLTNLDHVLVAKSLQIVRNVQQAGGRVSKECLSKIGTMLLGKHCSMDWVNSVIEGCPEFAIYLTGI